MRVTVKVAGYLIAQAGFAEKDFDFDRAPTLGELLKALGLKTISPFVVTRNGQAVQASDRLADGDRVFIAPFYSGG